MEEPTDTIIEGRTEMMVSPFKNSSLRKAHFIKPLITFIDGVVAELPSNSPSFVINGSEPIKWPLKVKFNGWRSPSKSWKNWIDRLLPLYQYTWKEFGIYEAIMNSTYEIRRDDELVLGIAERWCSETNTFIFPWGEATITLEDMMVLGGFSVLGDPISSPLDTKEKEIEEKLIQLRTHIVRKATKACQYAWATYFMENESELEHEAFLILWLSRFVFPLTFNTISKHVIPVAIHLARGKRIALAPAVLASIYRDLKSLKEAIVALTKLEDEYDVKKLTLWAPFQLVQSWALERFMSLLPNLKPNLIEDSEPRLARWHQLKKLKLENMRLVLDSAGESFLWQPYGSVVRKKNEWVYVGPDSDRDLMSYSSVVQEEWVYVGPDSDKALMSFARCLRVCELIGMDKGCTEQYLPHRVAKQFGMDQDIPCHVPRYNKTRVMAWRSYIKPIGNARIYIPSQPFESGVTTRYLEWWKQSYSALQDSAKGVVLMQTSRKSLPPQGSKVQGDTDEEDKLTISGMLIAKGKQNIVPAGSGDPLLDALSQNISSSAEDSRTLRSSKSPKSSTTLTRNSKQKKGDRHDDEPFPSVVISQCLSSRTIDDGNVVNKPNREGSPSLGIKRKNLSSSTTNDGAVWKIKSMMEHGDKITPAEPVTRGSEKSMEVLNLSKATIPSYNGESINDNGGGISNYCTPDIPALELEARIEKLERLVTVLKAARFG